MKTYLSCAILHLQHILYLMPLTFIDIFILISFFISHEFFHLVSYVIIIQGLFLKNM